MVFKNLKKVVAVSLLCAMVGSIPCLGVNAAKYTATTYTSTAEQIVCGAGKTVNSAITVGRIAEDRSLYYDTIGTMSVGYAKSGTDEWLDELSDGCIIAKNIDLFNFYIDENISDNVPVEIYGKLNTATKWGKLGSFNVNPFIYEGNGDNLNYTLKFDKTGVYDLCFKYKANIDGTDVWFKQYYENITVTAGSTGSAYNYSDYGVTPVDITKAGTNNIFDGAYYFDFSSTPNEYKLSKDDILTITVDDMLNNFDTGRQKSAYKLYFINGNIKKVELQYKPIDTDKWVTMSKDTNVGRNLAILDYEVKKAGEYDLKLIATDKDNKQYVWTTTRFVDYRHSYSTKFTDVDYTFSTDNGSLTYYVCDKASFEAGNPKWKAMESIDGYYANYKFTKAGEYIIAEKNVYTTLYYCVTVYDWGSAIDTLGEEFNCADFYTKGVSLETKLSNYNSAVDKLKTLSLNGANSDVLKKQKNIVKETIKAIYNDMNWDNAYFENIIFDLKAMLKDGNIFKDKFVNSKQIYLSMLPYEVDGQLAKFRGGSIEMPTLAIAHTDLEKIEIQQNGKWVTIGKKNLGVRYLPNGVYDIRFTYTMAGKEKTLTLTSTPIFSADDEHLIMDYTTEKLGYTPYADNYIPLNINTDDLTVGTENVPVLMDIDGGDYYTNVLETNFNNTAITYEMYIQQVGTTKWVKVASCTNTPDKFEEFKYTINKAGIYNVCTKVKFNDTTMKKYYPNVIIN